MPKELESYREQAIEVLKKEEEQKLFDTMLKLQKEDEEREPKLKQEKCPHIRQESDNHGRDQWCADCGFVIY